LHDEELFDVVMFPDGKYIASAGVDAKIYVWSLEAALKEHGGDQVEVRMRIVFQHLYYRFGRCFRVWMAMQSPTRSSRQLIYTSLSYRISPFE
jgi:hypothetical protein